MGSLRNLRRALYPTAVPRTTGSRMEVAGLWNTAVGIVRDGMYVVMLAVMCEGLG